MLHIKKELSLNNIKGKITYKIIAVSQEMRVAELWFLCTALLHHMFYQCLKFQVDSFYNLEVMAHARIQSENKQRAITQKRL